MLGGSCRDERAGVTDVLGGLGRGCGHIDAEGGRRRWDQLLRLVRWCLRAVRAALSTPGPASFQLRGWHVGTIRSGCSSCCTSIRHG